METIFLLVCGVGVGMLFHAPYQIFTKTLKPKELASGTSAFFLVRFTGATVGLVSQNASDDANIRTHQTPQSVAGAIFQNRLSQTLPPVFDASTINLNTLTAITPLSLQIQALQAASVSIQVC